MTRLTIRHFLLALTLASFASAQSPEPPPAPGVGLGDLLVAPTRIVLEGRDRTAEVTLVNIGESPATYRISFIQLRMNEDGRLEEIKGEPLEGELFADDLIRYSPRQVKLDPDQSQTVRLQVRKPGDLAAGEYRSHLLMRAIPESADPASKGEEADSISIRLIPIYGVSIPLIVRHGETRAEVALRDLRLEPGTPSSPPLLRFTAGRVGNRSVYGVFKIVFESGGKEHVLALTGGHAIYPPLEARRVEIPLTLPPDLRLENGVLRVAYLEGDANGGRIAEGELRLP